MNSIQQKIIGTWKLVYSVEIDNAGNKHYPFGTDALGYIMYDANGKMAVQIFRKDRKPFISQKFTSSSKDELVNIPQDYLAYCGNYEIDTENELVKHHIEGHLFPNEMSKTVARKYHFFDDKMSLKPWDGTNREILWSKIV